MPLSKNKIQGGWWGLFGAAVAISVLLTSTPAQAGTVTRANTTKAAATIISAAAGAAAGAAVAGAFGGPVTAGAAAATAAVGTVATGVTYAAVSQAAQHPIAAVQTYVAINPLTATFYITSHTSSVVCGIKDIVKWLF